MLPVLTLLLLALGVFAARGRRRALIGAGLGVAASMLVLAVGLFIFRGIYLNSVPPSKLPADAAAALFDTLVAFIKQRPAHGPGGGPGRRRRRVPGRAVGDRGPDPGGFRPRAGLDPPRRRTPGVRTGPAGTWTYTHRKALRISAVALAALVFVFWGQPTAAVAIVIAVLLLVVLGLIELIGSRPPAQPEAAGPS